MSVLVDIFPSRSDNYGVLVHDIESRRTAAIDAPDAGDIEDALNRRGWVLTDVLITHRHRDHVEGLAALKADHNITVVGPKAEAEKIMGLDVLVEDGGAVIVGETVFNVIATPGHTLGHICYHNAADGHVFVGDALFSLGCGAMMEGKPGPMWEGIKALRNLSDDTLMYCGHEYTQSNARFAKILDPKNAALTIRIADVERLRAANQPTIPVTMGMEKRTNPFLRADQPAMAAALGLDPDTDPAVVFAAIRKAKDNFA